MASQQALPGGTATLAQVSSCCKRAVPRRSMRAACLLVFTRGARTLHAGPGTLLRLHERCVLNSCTTAGHSRKKYRFQAAVQKTPTFHHTAVHVRAANESQACASASSHERMLAVVDDGPLLRETDRGACRRNRMQTFVSVLRPSPR